MWPFARGETVSQQKRALCSGCGTETGLHFPTAGNRYRLHVRSPGCHESERVHEPTPRGLLA